ncbi:MAG: hypothetical protein EOO27_09585 [Comamonadaceae bacterium]|nr:MAG: hypothetical protein EOO27_09585 [Comamonadaceae bacterium]
MNQSRDESGTLPASDSARVRKYRRLQSWYREVQLQVPAGTYLKHERLGSYLSQAAVAKQRDLNFLHPAAHEHAERRAVEVQTEGGSLEPQRLFHNMLSSMPLCFNLFGTMRGERNSFLPVFRSIFDVDATRIVDIVCEWAPRDPAARIGDHTAFDAIIRYEADGERRFVGVETKYTESFSQQDYDTQPYRDVTAASGWFTDDPSARERLKHPKANQLWRNVMLASRLEQHGSEGQGSVAVVALNDDPGAVAAVDLVGLEMSPSHRDRLMSVSIERILDATDAESPEISWWTTSFRRRYTDVSLPDSPEASQDPTGPRLGRDLEKTTELAATA